METAEDLLFSFAAVTFTVLAAFITALLFKRIKPVQEKRAAKALSLIPETLQPCRQDTEDVSEFNKPEMERQSPPQTTEDLLQDSWSSQEHEEGKKAAEKIEEPSCSVKTMNGEDSPLKYIPGKLRTSQIEKMMSKEELEEEQRVQQEQLAAIFKLLKENQDTFGEVTEKDMEEQLKLYSI